MKKVVFLLLGSAALLPAQAQWLRPEAVQGAFLGGWIGGLAGADRCHGFSGKTAALGAGIGWLAGTVLGEARQHNYYYPEAPGCVGSTTTALNVNFGYGYGGCGSSVYVNYAPNRICAPGTDYRPTRPNYVVSGTVPGAASGASQQEITSTPCATSTYTWTPRPQIADAPRVPDAPTF